MSEKPAGRYVSESPSTADWLKTLPLYPLPHHAISRLIHRLTRVKAAWFRRPLTRWFVQRFNVDMREAEQTDPLAFPTFNAFFTRELKADARPLPDDKHAVCCPADGAISALGPLSGDRIIQAKGHDYSLRTLLGGDATQAALFEDGSFMTVYLSPRDYHRVHMPLSGSLREVTHVPGRLFSVGRHTVKTVPGLFARNERIVCLFETAHGPMAVVLVGAINVASIETVWAGEITPPRGRDIRGWRYEPGKINLDRGEELGRFNMGSTAIVLFPPGMVEFSAGLRADERVQVRQAVGTVVGGEQ
ncbi:phosphatidylserine decarboxylase [Natronocella acetinitrilica]|uniref:Phosphatidylserine decarboxylase proenzyme n=1 Tax=Natronocella acetinitrilica TaxID=414046 RepID=A0AAE3KAQ9_9GAMM|nr:archaetidylserine decarboxylase [Natronocella acetinitrilica]MCP1673731.1 phosphatidylserine decarboxylase [Natronocella acetinitrilica]